MTAAAVAPELAAEEPKECVVDLLPPLGRALSTPAEVADYLEDDLYGWLHVIVDAAACRVEVPDMLPFDVSSVLVGVAAMLRTGTPLRVVDGSCSTERAARLSRLLREMVDVALRPTAPGCIGVEIPERTLVRLSRAVAEAAERASDGD